MRFLIILFMVPFFWQSPAETFSCELPIAQILAPDLQTWAISNTQGLWLYRNEQLQKIDEIPPAKMIFSGDSRWVATTTGYSVAIWNVITGERQAAWGEELPGSIITDISFSSDMATLAINFNYYVDESPGESGIYLLDSQSNTAPGYLTNRYFERPELVFFNSDSSYLALTSRIIQNGSGTPFGRITVYGVNTGEIVGDFTELRWIDQVVFSPVDQNLLASVDESGIIRLWDITSGESLPLSLPPQLTTTIAFSPDGALLATGGTDSKVRLWEVSSGAMLEVLPGQPEKIVELRYSASDNLVAVGQDLAWDVRTLELMSVAPCAV